MGRLARICLFFALSVAGGSVAYTQNMVPNGDIEVNCGATAGACPTFSAICVPGWSISHGTPQLNTTSGNIGRSVFAMWNLVSGGVPTGEGVYATLNQPTPTRGKYELCFYYRVVAGSTGTGNIVARFTNGLTPGAGISCGEAIPAPATQLVAYNNPVVAGAWQYVAVTLSASTAFTQLNIYPVANTNMALGIEIDGFKLNYCGTNLVATPLALPMPSGFYARSGSITATSLGGARVVTSAPAVSTTFRSGQFVLLEPNFVATPSPGWYFLADIGPCGCAASPLRTTQGEMPGLTAKDFVHDEYALATSDVLNVSVSPNPILDLVTVEADEALAQVRILDLSGNLLLSTQTQDGTRKMKIETSGLPSGVYLLEATAACGRKLTTKIVKI